MPVNFGKSSLLRDGAPPSASPPPPTPPTVPRAKRLQALALATRSWTPAGAKARNTSAAPRRRKSEAQYTLTSMPPLDTRPASSSGSSYALLQFSPTPPPGGPSSGPNPGQHMHSRFSQMGAFSRPASVGDMGGAGPGGLAR